MHTSTFALTPDPKAFYESPRHRKSLMELRAGVESGRGLLVLVGEIGTGKTTLVHALLGTLDASIRSAYVSDTLGAFSGLLHQVAADFRLDASGHDEMVLRQRIRAFLLECAAKRVRAVLVIDEAQHLTDDAFEKLRLLSDLDTYDTKLLQLILVGPPVLADRLARPALRALRERVAVFSWLEPLDRAESKRYIEHRLTRAGSTPSAFSADAMNLAARIANGNPRRLNIVCHDAMLASSRAGRAHVSARAVRRAAGARVTGARGGRRISPLAPPLRGYLAVALTVCVVAGTATLLRRHDPELALPPPTEPALRAAAEPTLRAAAEAAPLPHVESASTTAVVPVPEPPPVQPHERQIRVPLGANLSAIAREHYGSDAGPVLRRIVQANPAIVDMDLIRAGQTLRLPEVSDE